jgi:DNA modification methylase
MKVETAAIETVVPYARNPRKNEAAVAKVAASIKEFGWRQPIVVDSEMVIIAGHTRLGAARMLGMTNVPVHIAKDFTPQQIKAYRIADNRVGQEAEWDEDLLRLELLDLESLDFDLSETGFDDDELAALMADIEEGLTDPDDVPDAPEEPVTVAGDVWLLGKHRLVCGDSTDADDVAKCMNGVEPHLMVTDPPYGLGLDASWREDALGGKRADGKVENDDRADWREAWALFPGDVAYVWTNGAAVAESILSLEAAGLRRRSLIVWVKSQFVIGRGDYHSKEEECWYAVRKNKKGHYVGGRKQSTVWEIDKPRKSETGHSTQKPVECMKRPIENNSSPGQAVYDPFLGSGTTIIAAEMTGRACHGLELSPEYCDVIVTRWQEFTGKKATLDADGRSFAAVAKDRNKAAA